MAALWWRVVAPSRRDGAGVAGDDTMSYPAVRTGMPSRRPHTWPASAAASSASPGPSWARRGWQMLLEGCNRSMESMVTDSILILLVLAVVGILAPCVRVQLWSTNRFRFTLSSVCADAPECVADTTTPGPATAVPSSRSSQARPRYTEHSWYDVPILLMVPYWME